jgi:serine protease
MTTWIAVLSLLGGVPLGAETMLVREQAGRGRERVLPGRVLVQFNTGTEDARVAATLHAAGGREEWRSGFTRGLRLVRVPAGEGVEHAVARFGKLPEVEFAEPVYLRQLAYEPNDEFLRFQWNMRLINAPRIWDIQKGKNTVVVAVLDSGVAHEDLAPFTVDLGIFTVDQSSFPITVGPFRRTPDWGGTTFVKPYDAVFGTAHAWDDEGHGTHVASTVAEAGDNRVGFTGLAYNAALMPVKVCLSQPRIDPDLVGCPTFAIADGIDYARTNGAKIINLSLGGTFPSEAERRAVQRAAAANMVIVASAGNENGPVGYPAAFAEVIAVGAVDGRRQKASYSNFGPELDLVAPGGTGRDDADSDGLPDFVFQQSINPLAAEQGVYTEVTYLGLAGTSMASPHVAAAAALLVSQGISDANSVREALQQNADDLGAAGRDNQFGFGLINPVKALTGLGLNH